MAVNRIEAPICGHFREIQQKTTDNPFEKDSKKNENFVSDLNKDINLRYKSSSLSDAEVAKGTIKGLPVVLRLNTNFIGNKAILSGKIDEIPLKLTLCHQELKGELPEVLKHLEPHLRAIMSDKIVRDMQLTNAAMLESFICFPQFNY